MTKAAEHLARVRRINRRLKTATGQDRRRLLNKRCNSVIAYIKALRPPTISTAFLKSLLV